MKSIVRLFVLSLAVTGAVASAHSNRNVAFTSSVHGRTGALPVPICPPNDPNACNLCRDFGCPPPSLQ